MLGLGPNDRNELLLILGPTYLRCGTLRLLSLKIGLKVVLVRQENALRMIKILSG